MDWNREMLHARCNLEKRTRMTPRAFELAKAHGITPEPIPGERVIRNLRHGLHDLGTAIRCLKEAEEGYLSLNDDERSEIRHLIKQISVRAERLKRNQLD